MVDITHKNSSLRKARARAVIKFSSEDTIRAILERRVPKGDVFEMSKTAGLFAAKRTSDMIPDCHPLPIEYAKIRFIPHEMEVEIEAEIHTIYKTGVEVEAMHAASVTALTMYDMLKPIDGKLEITSIKLVEKSGGESDFSAPGKENITAAVIVCSDSIAAGKKEDKAGKAIIEKLMNCNVRTEDYIIIPDEIEAIRNKVSEYSAAGYNLILLTGGTGLSPGDVTPEALEPLLDRTIPGISETVRNYGQQRTPYSMLSRSIAGTIGNTLVIALPGSTKGAAESMNALFPPVLHIFRIMDGATHKINKHYGN